MNMSKTKILGLVFATYLVLGLAIPMVQPPQEVSQSQVVLEGDSHVQKGSEPNREQVPEGLFNLH